MSPSLVLRRLAIALPLVVFAVVYGLRAGHGFIQDDYNWVRQSWIHSPADVLRVLESDNGFYRPVVSLTFALNAWMFGTAPLGYGLTNVALALGCAWAVMTLARALEMPRGAAAMAGIVWLMNFYVTKTAVLWISGRTSLVAVLAAVLCAAAAVRGRLAASLIWLAIALFSKEDTVLVPVIVALCLWMLTRRTPGAFGTALRPRAWIAGAGLVTLGYLAVRSLTGAMTPATAPQYYQFMFEPAGVLRNIAEYADRTSTLAVAAMLGGVALLGFRREAFDAGTRRTVACGAIWLTVGLGFAYILPLRSDLYAGLPAVGSSLAAAAVASALWRTATEPARGRALLASLVVWVGLAPVYWTRTDRMVGVAEFSAARLDELTACLADVPITTGVRVDDVESRDPRAPNLAAAFGAAMGEAYAVRTGRDMSITLVEPGSAAASKVDPGVVRLVLENGHVRPARSATSER